MTLPFLLITQALIAYWLYNHQNDLYPKPDSSAKQIPEGHRANDYIVPFLPLYTHEEMFATADTLGYNCSLFSELQSNTTTQPSTTDSSSASLQVSLGLFFSLLIVFFNNYY